MARVTMDDVAREAGVSRALVSLAYRGEAGVSAVTRERILAVGAELHYTPNRMASRLAERRANSIGLFLQDLHNDVFADIYDGVRSLPEFERLHLVLAVGTLDGASDAAALETLAQSRVDVVIAAGLQLADAELARYCELTPVVSVARLVPGVDSVASENRLGAREATDHLIDLGHTRIAFLANPPSDGYLGRREGYEEAMHNAGLPPLVVPSAYAREAAAFDAVRLLDAPERPTAILAHNDQAALGVLDALTLRGLSAGRDVSVIGYDNSSVSRAPGTALTSVDIHAQSLGAAAARLALRRLKEPGAAPRHETSLPALVRRSTSGPPPGAD